MQLPLSWIKELIDTQSTPLEMSHRLTSMGIEVDAIVPETFSFTDVCVGEVKEVRSHPNADKLVLAKVFDGKNTFEVVCGAPNCKEGMKSAFARPGAKLVQKEKEIEIVPVKIRGCESFGMLASAKELGISDEDEGILEFSADTPIGVGVETLFQDTIFHISITPNLGYALSLLGVVRELTAGLGGSFVLPHIEVTEESRPAKSKIIVDVHHTKDCPKYACRVVEGVKVEESPIWLQRRLNACGIRSVNNVVDVTNYVMLELGQPMHAFDLQKIQGGKVMVRRAVNGEKLLCLDGKERELREDHLVIADVEKPLAVAGVMGGALSEVTNETTEILLESAYFDPSRVRKASKELQLASDSSRRFERGVDPEGVERALDRAAMLLQEISGISPLQGVIFQGLSSVEKVRVHCRLDRIGEILGVHVSLDEVQTILKQLFFTYEWDGKNTFLIEVPSFRHDIRQEIDIIEEVARIKGYENIPIKTPYFTPSPLAHAPIYLLEQAAKRELLGEGLQEFITCDLIAPHQVQWVTSTSDESCVKVQNPSSVEQSILRPSLIPGLLSVVKHNWSLQSHTIRGFEIGKVHFKLKDQYKEQSVATLVLAGRLFPCHFDRTDRFADFLDLKGIVENFLEGLRVDDVSFEKSNLDFYHPGRQAKIMVGHLEIGSIGEVHPLIAKELDVPISILVAEISLHDIFEVQSPEKKMRQLSVYPSSTRDWTLTLHEEVAVGSVLNLIRAVESEYLESVSLKDVYRSDKVGSKKKNVTIHFVYRDQEKTMSQEAVDLEHAKVTEKVLDELPKHLHAISTR